MPSQVPSTLATTIGRNIRLARKSADLTQRGLAAKLGVESMQVSKWERGWHRPTDANLASVALQTGHDLAWFYTTHDQRRAT